MSVTRISAVRISAATVAGLALVAGGLAVASPANAKGAEVRTKGSCSAGATWKLKAKADNPGIELEFEVDSNRVGQVWAVKITDNGVKVVDTKATTVAPSGSFTVNRRVANQAGADAFVATATNTVTGQTCVGKATL